MSFFFLHSPRFESVFTDPTLSFFLFSSPLKNVAFTTMRQYMIRICTEKVGDESVGNVTAVVVDSLPLRLELCQKTFKSPQSLHSARVMYKITTVKVTAILDFTLDHKDIQAVILVQNIICSQL